MWVCGVWRVRVAVHEAFNKWKRGLGAVILWFLQGNAEE